MSAIIIDGRKIASEIEEHVKKEIAAMQSKPSIDFFVVSKDPATGIYVRKKKEACERVGIVSNVTLFEESMDESALINAIKSSSSTGIIVQLPLPQRFDVAKISSLIPPEKDADCMNPENLGKMFISPTLLPCTVAGIMRLLDEAVRVKGKTVAIVNRSYIGKSLSLLLSAQKATVIMCGRNSDLNALLPEADIVISAAGSKHLIKKEMIKPGAVVIDVGITREDNRICGDVSPDVAEVASYMTPVPGGVGPMTVAMLMKNCLHLARLGHI